MLRCTLHALAPSLRASESRDPTAFVLAGRLMLLCGVGVWCGACHSHTQSLCTRSARDHCCGVARRGVAHLHRWWCERL